VTVKNVVSPKVNSVKSRQGKEPASLVSASYWSVIHSESFVNQYDTASSGCAHSRQWGGADSHRPEMKNSCRQVIGKMFKDIYFKMSS